MELCSEQGFALRMAQGAIVRGWAWAMQGQGEEGMAQLREGMATCRATGAEYLWPSYLAMLAEVYGKVGQVEEGLRSLSEALTVVDKTGERWCEAELYRLKGELTLQRQSQTSHGLVKTSHRKSEDTNSAVSSIQRLESEAEEYLHKAIEISCKQQAKSLELRATMSLARLWQSQGKRAEAHTLLSEVYNWFTEGFDTKDLQEAKALLEGIRY
jgi:predicted ATPase